MSCTAWHDNLTERLYGEIEKGDDARLTAHLDSCASCRQTLDAFQSVRGLMRDDEQDVRRVPRVVVLRERFRFRPALMAASLAGTVILAGLGAGAGYAWAIVSGAAAQPTVPGGDALIRPADGPRARTRLRIRRGRRSRRVRPAGDSSGCSAAPSGHHLALRPQPRWSLEANGTARSENWSERELGPVANTRHTFGRRGTEFPLTPLGSNPGTRELIVAAGVAPGDWSTGGGARNLLEAGPRSLLRRLRRMPRRGGARGPSAGRISAVPPPRGPRAVPPEKIAQSGARPTGSSRRCKR
jgi:hypothetical protein